MSHDGKLVMMANQIGLFFAAQARGEGGEDKAVAGIATHLRKFWDPSMRAAIIAQTQAGAATALQPLPRRAVEQLAQEAAAQP